MNECYPMSKVLHQQILLRYGQCTKTLLHGRCYLLSYPSVIWVPTNQCKTNLPRQLSTNSEMHPCNNPGIPFLLVCSLLCTAFLLPSAQSKVGKPGREKLQLKLHSKQEKVEPEQVVIYEGLPGDVEYEVDLSDQETVRHREEGSKAGRWDMELGFKWSLEQTLEGI